MESNEDVRLGWTGPLKLSILSYTVVVVAMVRFVVLKWKLACIVKPSSDDQETIPDPEKLGMTDKARSLVLKP